MKYFLLLTCFAIVGCGGGAEVPELGYVSGKVTLGGQPLANANVTFTPKDARPSSGVTDADGSYTLSYTIESEGAVPGNHKVTVEAISSTEDYEGDAPPEPPELPASASDGSISKEVKAGSNEINIEL